jgi:hypothetical protein
VAVSDREYATLTATVADHENRLRNVETSSAEMRGAAREAARLASRLVAVVSIFGVLAQAAVGLYFHVDHHSTPAPPAHSSTSSSSSAEAVRP